MDIHPEYTVRFDVDKAELRADIAARFGQDFADEMVRRMTAIEQVLSISIRTGFNPDEINKMARTAALRDFLEQSRD